MKNQAVTRASKKVPTKPPMCVSTILKSWGVPIRKGGRGGEFWDSNAGILPFLLFDARKAWKALRKGTTDHAECVEINRKWEFIKRKLNET